MASYLVFYFQRFVGIDGVIKAVYFSSFDHRSKAIRHRTGWIWQQNEPRYQYEQGELVWRSHGAAKTRTKVA